MPKAVVQGDIAVWVFVIVYTTCMHLSVSGVYRRQFCAYGSYGLESEPKHMPWWLSALKKELKLLFS